MFIIPAAVVFLCGAAPAQDDVISVDSSIVVLNASITDASGKAVEALGQKLFHVFEDGTEQNITSFGAEDTPFAAVILLDTSGSMEERVVLARSAAIEFLSGMRTTDSASIYNFDSKITRVRDFSNSADMPERFYELKANGMTLLNDAVYKAAQDLSKRPEKRRAIVVLSDGADTANTQRSEKALQAALAIDATIYTVDMAPAETRAAERMASDSVLKEFAEKSGGKFVSTPGGVALRETFQRIVAELGSQYTLAYEPSNPKHDGKWRSIELRVDRPRLTIRTRKGYKAPKK